MSEVSAWDGQSYKFGDIVENHWAGDSNPTKRGVVVGIGTRSGRVNSGPYIKVRDVAGRTGDYPRAPALEVIGTIFGKTEEEINKILVSRRPEPEWIAQWRHTDWHKTYDRNYEKCQCKSAAEDKREDRQKERV